MAWIATTTEPGTFGNTGQFDVIKPTSAVLTDGSVNTRPLPSGVNATTLRPCFAPNNDGGTSRLYCTGGWTDNLVLTENFTLARQGIIAPINPIISGAGAGLAIGVTPSGTGVTGEVICYVSWWDDLNQRGGALSAASPTLSLTNQGIAWTNLPTDGGGDPTVTHIRLWRSVDGNSPLLVTQRDLGTTAVTENVPTLSLGIDFGDPFQKFPRCRFNIMYHDRQAMAGDDQFPDRIYLSLLNEPERYGGLFLRTRKGEAVVGLVEVRDLLVVLCAASSYIIQGYTEDDLECVVLEPRIGCIAHAAISKVHGLAIIPAQIGWYLCSGNSMHPISKDFQITWRNEYEANQDAYEASWSVDDVNTNCFKLYTGASATPRQSPQSLIPLSIVPTVDASPAQTNMYWVIDYTDMIAETGGNFQQPKLTFDVRTRSDDCAAILSLPGAKRGALFTGSCDGIARQENVATNADDDGDVFQKTMFVMTGTYFFGKPGGDLTDGFRFHSFWNFMECERSAYSLDLYIGDERHNTAAFSPIDPDPGHIPAQYHTVVPAGHTESETGDQTLTPKVVHFCEPMKDGRGVAVAITAVAPAYDPTTLRVPSWKGFGGTRGPGNAPRGLAGIVVE